MEYEKKKVEATKEAFNENPEMYWMLAPFVAPLSKKEAESRIMKYENSVMSQMFPGNPLAGLIRDQETKRAQAGCFQNPLGSQRGS